MGVCLLTLLSDCPRANAQETALDDVANSAGAQEATLSLPEAQIHEVASQILNKAGKAGCKPRDCRIVVANFTLPSGYTSQLGIQLADQFSREFALQQAGFKTIDRSALQSFLEKERISPGLLVDEKALRWLGKQLNATAILTGVTERADSDVRVRLRLLSCSKENKGFDELLTIPVPASKAALGGIDPITNLVSKDRWASAPAAYRAGSAGVTNPVCVYCPNPDYSNYARAAKSQGTVVLDVVVSPEGNVTSATIIRGTPFGMNDMALNAVRQWKFKPAMLQGKPVAAAVTVEVSFRLLDR